MKHEPLPLFCNVCRSEIPEGRRNRKAITCSPECHGKLRIARRLETRNRRCPACGIPSSPEERRLFKQWRDSTGQARRRRGRPKAVDWAKRLVTMGAEWPEDATQMLIFDASNAHQATVSREQFDKARAAIAKLPAPAAAPQPAPEAA